MGTLKSTEECKLVEFGPIQLVALKFPDPDMMKGEMLKEIFRLSKAEIIRVVGLLVIVKDEKGNIKTAQISELSDKDRTKLGAAIGALIGLGYAGTEGAEAGAKAGAERVTHGLSRERISEIAQKVPKGTAAGILLVEHLWAKKLKEIAQNQHGVLMAEGFIEPAALVALGTELAEGAETAEKVETEKMPGTAEAEAAAGE
jgi:uncharacterized membrane protein